ncbi:glycerophosphodiester phosphodiesterase [Pararobbsia alpina]|uniref:Glycerophosphodiester phosphodiesterase, cytoplasmic n=1 Tax=Pararobbsia alpina TaxID=621374 RepID=A0A6S7BQ81_9BURK|nr:glycerophosphodiester phosphodiesterase [Pararobbsia alpina]CAB3795889.1 Glycerophosphodiester phosphodiesterase, cytoplasmic [Pararobbsia alpina]
MSIDRRDSSPASSLSSLPTWPYPALVAHRCAGVLAPENTLAGLAQAARHHVGMVEFDAKLSADDVPFLLHDDDVDRTSNGHGPAASLSYARIAALDAGSWFGAAFSNERMPTLEAVAQRCIELKLCANVEIKPCPGREVVTGVRVAQAVQVLWKDAPVPPLLSSFSEEALDAARRTAPELARGVLFGRPPGDWLARAQRLACVSVHFDHTQIDRLLIDAIRAAGFRTLAYTVNDAARARTLREWGVDAICTDRIDTVSL